MTRKYSSISVETTLASGISNSATSMTVATGTGSALMGGVTLAAGNVDIFTVALDVDTQNEEIVYITAVSSDTFTIVRGQAGTSAISHTGGATVKHVLTSADLNFYTAGVATADAAVPSTVVTAKADLLVGASSGVVDNLSVGTNNQVLTADSAQTLGVKWATPVPADLTINAKTANYTLVAGDVNKLITMSDAGTLTLTVPNGVFTTGQQINVQRLGAGAVQIRNDGTTVLTSTGATSTAPNLRAQYSACTIICTSSNNFTAYLCPGQTCNELPTCNGASISATPGATTYTRTQNTNVTTYTRTQNTNVINYTRSSATNVTTTTYTSAIRIISSVSGSVVTDSTTTLATSTSSYTNIASMQSNTNGTTLTVKGYSGAGQTTQLGSTITRTPSSPVRGTSVGTIKAPTTDNQGSTLDSFSATL
jgi:hypothetical protein